MHAREPKQPLCEMRGFLGRHPRFLTTIREGRTEVTCFAVESGVWWRRRPAGNFFCSCRGAKLPAGRRRYQITANKSVRTTVPLAVVLRLLE